MMIEERTWTTANEIQFFKKVIPKEISKLQFLINYKEALRHRIYWGTIEKRKVLAELNKEIKQLQGEQKWLV
jgi:hypothetical protein